MNMSTRTEELYGRTAKKVMSLIDPIKKLIIETHCMAHKYINNKALELLKNEGYIKQYNCLNIYIKNINEGVVWADQGFKSINHFYHFTRRKGLYGFSNLLNEAQQYCNLAHRYLDVGDISMSMFYFGAACHLIQDATVPHHANNKLLKHHRKFELFIIKNITLGHCFEARKGIKRYKTMKDYIENNTLAANSAYYKYENIKEKDDRYMKVATLIIQEAQVTTAGFMLDFYDSLKDKVQC